MRINAARCRRPQLRVAGRGVWFDQNELVGGDAWDAKMRKLIKDCALFVPVIPAATQARREGYFRIEWKLAAQRTHAFADRTRLVLPVVIDGAARSARSCSRQGRRPHSFWTVTAVPPWFLRISMHGALSPVV